MKNTVARVEAVLAIIFLSLLFLIPLKAFASAVPYLVKDINAGAASSSPNLLVNINGIVYFSANDGVNGTELWKTDGTASGTVMVKDIYPGSGSSSPYYLTNVNGTLYFMADDGSDGAELWKSDGTASGTVMVKDINPGSAGSTPQYLTNVDGTLYFAANDGTYGTELWKSDGTTSGTVMVKDIYPGSSGSLLQNLTNLNGTLFFVAYEPTYGQELWKSDGTDSGTIIVKDIYPGGSSAPSGLTAIGGTLFFSANDGVYGAELWKSDGTAAGTVLVWDIYGGTGSSSPVSLKNVNGTLYFRANDVPHGSEIWKSDGTLAGTVIVKDINPGTGSANPASLTDVGGVLYFRADDGTDGVELWKSDGTSAGTVMVKDINPSGGSSAPRNFTDVGGAFYFQANDGTHGAELWKSDGTSAGTVMVADIYAGASGSSPSNLTVLNNLLLFSATDANGTELWAVSLDDTPPSSSITAPANNTTFVGTSCNITGTASDSGSGVQMVEVGIAPNGGSTTWYTATGTTDWNYVWTVPAPGMYNITSRATDNAGNVETLGAGVTVTAMNSLFGTPENQHYDWDGSMNGGNCSSCHVVSSTFLPSNYVSEQSGFCYSCHNSSSVGHDEPAVGKHAHPTMVNVTSSGADRRPTYGSITTALYNNQPFSRLKDGKTVVCATCHNVMEKTEDYGRVWELTTTTDQLTYTLQHGGWDSSGYLVPKVYRDTTLWATGGPTYSKTKKDYLVDPSEYTYDPVAGTITFKTAQSLGAYIYVTLDYPYLRASSEGNRLCSDCHTQATHKGDNCLVCHQSHNSSNIVGLREKVRASNFTTMPVSFLRYTGINSFADGDGTRNGVCEVCHTTTKYYRCDGSGFANHSGGFNFNKQNCTVCHSHSNGFTATAQPMTYLTINDNLSVKNVAVGNIVMVELVSNSDSGYLWYTDGLDGSKIRLVKTATIPGQLIGAPATQRFYFEMLAPADTALNLLEYRVWEGRNNAINSFGVTLHIQ